MTDTIDDHRQSETRKHTLISERSRRSVLKAAGVTGFGALGVPIVSKNRDDEYVKIAATIQLNENGDEVVADKRKVPKKWLEHVKKARNINKKVKNRYHSNPVILLIGITAYGDAILGFQKHAIQIRLKKDKGGHDIPDFPEQIDGIPILVDKNAQEPEGQSHDNCGIKHYDTDYDPVKGGVLMESHSNYLNDCESGEAGTLCVRTKKVGHAAKYFLAARHVFLSDDCSTSGPSGAAAYQHGDRMGTVSDSFQNHDAVLIELDSTSTRNDYSAVIVDDGNEVDGYETKNQVASMVSNSESAKRRGIMSGKDTHTLLNYDVTLFNCSSFEFQDYIEYQGSGEGGDSGGPYFVKKSGYNSLVGMHTFNPDGSFRMYGPAAYGLANSYSLNFT